MVTRFLRRTLITLAALSAAATAVAGTQPVLVVERVSLPDHGERLAIGFRANALCLGLQAELEAERLRIVTPRVCTTCAAVDA